MGGHHGWLTNSSEPKDQKRFLSSKPKGDCGLRTKVRNGDRKSP